MQSLWKRGGQRAKTKMQVEATVGSALTSAYNKAKKTPDDYYQSLVENNTTHFSLDELDRLLASFKRVTGDRLQVGSWAAPREICPDAHPPPGGNRTPLPASPRPHVLRCGFRFFSRPILPS